MPMGRAVFSRETGDDEVGSKFPDNPDDIRENFFAVPDAQGFLGGFREAEVVRASEELPAVVDTPRRQQLLRANDTELLAQLRPDQILSAVAARERQVGGVVKRTVRPVGDQAGIFVVRMSGDVEDAAEHVQPLKRETNVCGIHRLGCLCGATQRSPG